MFSPEAERKLVDHITKMNDVFHGLTRKQIKKLTFEYDQINTYRIVLKMVQPENKGFWISAEEIISASEFTKNWPSAKQQILIKFK